MAASGQLQEPASDPLVSMVFYTDVESKFWIVNGSYLANNYKFSISAMGTKQVPTTGWSQVIHV
jgi:hypothetical protein